MKPILISYDKNFSKKNDLIKVVEQLNRMTQQIKFEMYKEVVDIKSNLIKHPDTFKTIDEAYYEYQKSYEYGIMFCEKPFKDDWFYNEYNGLVIVSMVGWKDLTTHPFENGLLYLIGSIMSLDLETTFIQHTKNRGCINDYLFDKTGIHEAMSKSSFCKSCLERLRKKLKTKDEKMAFKDLKMILDDLSSASRWDQSIFEYWANRRDPRAEKPAVAAKHGRKPIKNGEIKILIASPGDVMRERELLLDTLESRFRRDHEKSVGYRVILTGWEQLPSVTGYPQDSINQMLTTQVDIIVGIFKHRLGTPTVDQKTGDRRSESGAAEEILYALNGKGPLGMVYFSSKAPAQRLDNPNIDDELNQFRRLEKFKKEILNKVMLKNYRDAKDLITIVNDDLAKVITEYFVHK